MAKHLGFLKVSSIVVKVFAWIFLLLGFISGILIILGFMPGNPRWLGVIVLVAYIFFFFLLYLIAKIADLLVNIANKIESKLDAPELK